MQKTDRNPPGYRELIMKRLERLIDIGGRNRAIYFRRRSRSTLRILEITMDEVSDLLDGRGIELAKYLVGNMERASHRFGDEIKNEEVIETLNRLRRSVEEEERERGYSNLYFVMGLIIWSEGGGSVESPLVIAKCVIEPKLDRRKGEKRYLLKVMDEPRPNPSLMLKMRRDYGIDLESVWKESSYGIDEGGLPHYEAFLNNLRGSIEQRGWRVEESFWIARLSFENQPIYEDGIEMLEKGVFDNCIVARALCGDKEAIKPVESSSENVDEVEKEMLPTPLPCDMKQSEAILLAEKGYNLVVHGPPGTGKSQLIANLIARSVETGKRILFVTEKRDAAKVVYERLDKIGLSEHVLFLHGDLSKLRGKIFEELYSMLSQTPSKTLAEEKKPEFSLEFYQDVKEYTQWLVKAKPVLEGVARLEVKAGRRVTPAILSLAKGWKASKERWPRLIEYIQRIDQTHWERLKGIIKILSRYREQALYLLDNEQLLRFFKEDGEVEYGLYYFLFSNFGPMILNNASRLALLFQRLAQLAEVVEDWDAFIECVNDIDVARKYVELADISHQLESLGVDPRNINGTRDDLQRLMQELSSLGLFDRFFRREKCKRLVHDAKSMLRGWTLRGSTLEQALSLAVEYLNIREELYKRGLRYVPRRRFNPKAFQNIVADFNSVGINIGELLQTLQTYDNDLHRIFKDLSELMMAVSRLDIRDHHELRQLVEAITELRRTDVGWVVEEMLLEDNEGYVLRLLVGTLEHDLTPNDLIALPNPEPLDKIPRTPTLRIALKGIVEFYEELNSEKKGRRYWQYVAMKRSVEATKKTSSKYEFVDTIMREHSKKKRKMSVRRLLENHRDEVLALKPVVIASPYTVHALPKDRVFDLVVFDETSQLRLEKVLTSIARGKSVVVIGDEKQMPPTAYFEKMAYFEQEGEEEDGEGGEEHGSLLDSVLQNMKLFKEVYLEWYYRGEHESLIAFSNREFYNDRLVTLPSIDNRPRCCLVYLKGSRYKSGKRINEDEAKAVLKAIVELSNEGLSKTDTIMVVAMNVEQQDLIIRLLEKYIDESLSSDGAKEINLDSFLGFGKTDKIIPDVGETMVEIELGRIGEPVRDPGVAGTINTMLEEGRLTVRNLETVQGSEADVVILSLTYGKDADTGRIDGRFFGPLNHEGSERRVNVLVSRARKRLIAISSIRSSDLAGLREIRNGVGALKRFLEYLENGCRLEKPEQEGQPESPFEESVILELEHTLKNEGLTGLEIVPQVGVGGYRIDIGIKKGDKYILGIECDGRTFHSHSSVRDRDYIRQKHLEKLGWKIYRIWSSEWWENRERVIKQVVDEIKKALNPESLRGQASSP
jgi:very-short-patch-repair endonuclease